MKRVSRGSSLIFLLALCALAALEHPTALGGGKEPKAAKAEARAPTDSASIAMGGRLFSKYCETCHGKTGHGNGPTAAALNPKPRDFTAPTNFKSKNDDEMFAVISKGGVSRKLSPLMPAWGTTLKKEQIWQLIAYIRGFPARDSIRHAHAAK